MINRGCYFAVSMLEMAAGINHSYFAVYADSMLDGTTRTYISSYTDREAMLDDVTRHAGQTILGWFTPCAWDEWYVYDFMAQEWKIKYDAYQAVEMWSLHPARYAVYAANIGASVVSRIMPRLDQESTVDIREDNLDMPYCNFEKVEFTRF